MKIKIQIGRCVRIAFTILLIGLWTVISSASIQVTQKSLKKTEAVFHTVKSGETLFGISKKYKVKTSEVKKWNKLKSDKVKSGQKLIVGYRQSRKVDEVKKDKSETQKKINTSPQVEEKIPEPEIVKPILPVEKKKESIPAAKQTEKREITEQGLATWIDDEMINPDKYYALHRTAPMGTIIKITNGINGKSVYVKVVGKVSARDEGQKIIIKISKSAADKLEILDERFQAELSYSLSP